MIELSRNTARLYRTLLRKSVLAADPRRSPVPILCQADKHGLTLFCELGEVGLGYHQAGNLPADTMLLPASLLAEIEDRKDTPVLLEQTAPLQGRASWQEAGVPRQVEFNTGDASELPRPPGPGRDSVSQDGSFLRALGEAARTASHETSRYAMSHIQMRGKEGALVATDGHHLLIQKGFQLPWTEDLLIPALPAFCCRELPDQEPVRLSRSKEKVLLEVGPWLFSLRIDSQSRFPDVNRVIPSAGAGSSRLYLDPEDAGVLVRALPKLPAREESTAPITLDLGRPIAVRVQDEKGPAAEVVLGRSRFEGPAVQAVMNRKYLLRAIQLGFQTISIVKPDRPFLCKDETRIYVWMPLEASNAVPTENARSVQVPAQAPPENNTNRTQPRSPTPMPTNDPKPPEPHRNGIQDSDQFDLVTEMEALRNYLQQAVVTTTRLIAALKHQKRQTKAMSAALASLRRLPEFTP